MTVTRGAQDLLRRYSWPGNVREIENVVRRILIFNDREIIDEAVVETVLPQVSDRANESLLPLSEIEKRHILQVLQTQRNDKRVAAEILQISLKTLYNKLHQYGQI